MKKTLIWLGTLSGSIIVIASITIGALTSVWIFSTSMFFGSKYAPPQNIIPGTGLKVNIEFNLLADTGWGSGESGQTVQKYYFSNVPTENYTDSRFEWNDQDKNGYVDQIIFTDEISDENIKNGLTLYDYLYSNNNLFNIDFYYSSVQKGHTIDGIFGLLFEHGDWNYFWEVILKKDREEGKWIDNTPLEKVKIEEIENLKFIVGDKSGE